MQRMSLSIKEEEQLSETVKEFPVLYDKAAKGYKTLVVYDEYLKINAQKLSHVISR